MFQTMSMFVILAIKVGNSYNFLVETPSQKMKVTSKFMSLQNR